MSHQPEGCAVLAPVRTVDQAAEAARAGARLVDAGDDTALVTAISRAGLGVLICGPGEIADLSRDARIALRTGGRLLCDGTGEAERAAQQGIAPDRIVVQVRPSEAAAAVQAGWQTLIDADAPANPGVAANADVPANAGTPGIADIPANADAPGNADIPGDAAAPRTNDAFGNADAVARAGAVAAVGSWLGVSIIRTRHVTQVRRCLDMTESIRGTRQPAWAVRGLA